MLMYRITLLLLGLSLVVSLKVQAKDVYRCTEDDGSIVLSDTPCARTLEEMEQLHIVVPPAPDPVPAPTTGVVEQDSELIREYKEYMSKREALVERRNRVLYRLQSRGYNQTLSQMTRTRAQVNRIDREIEALDDSWNLRSRLLR